MLKQVTHSALAALLVTGATGTLTLQACWKTIPGDIPSDLRVIDDGVLAPKGEWALIRGKTKDLNDRAFLLNIASGKWLAIRLSDDAVGSSSKVTFSADGRRAAWIEPGLGPHSESRVVAWDLDSLAPPVALRTLSLSSNARLALSPDGGQLAVLDGETLFIVTLLTDTVRLRTVVTPAKGKPYFVVFLNSARVRLYPGQRFESSTSGSPRIDEIVEVDTVTGRVSITGRAESAFPGMFLRCSADGERVLVLEHQRTRVTLRDGRTGALIAELPTRDKLRCAAFLADGGIAVVVRQSVGSLLQVFSAAGTETVAISLPTASGAVTIAGEVEAGSLLLGLNPNNQNDRQHWTFFLVDLSAGRIARTIPGLAPLMPMEFWWAPTLRPADLAGNATRFFLDREGALIRVDPMSGRRQKVFGAETESGQGRRNSNSGVLQRPNTRVQRTRSSASPPHSPLTRRPLDGLE